MNSTIPTPTPAFVVRQGEIARATHAIEKTKEQLSQQVAQVEQFASQQLDRTSKWASANPVSALGVGFAAGMFVTFLFGRSERR